MTMIGAIIGDVVGSRFEFNNIKTKEFELPKPDLRFTLDIMKAELKRITLPAIKILITGNGRVSQGAQYILNEIGADRLEECQYLSA